MISLPFTLATTTNFNYIAAYFTEPHEFLDNDTRLIDIYVEDDFMLTVEPEIGICTCALIRIQSDGTLNVQLRQNGSSTLPPVISAIEVYTAGNPLVPSTTSKDDCKFISSSTYAWTHIAGALIRDAVLICLFGAVDGLQVFINAFEQLSGWSGDPCLPNNTVWQWLGCNGNDPPRVSKM